MNLLIDGHNLIGSNAFSDIRLSDEDDEAKLVMRLKVWQSRLQRTRGGGMTVIFDRGIPGGRDVKMGGSGVEVVFAADPAQADDLIRRRLRKPTKGLILVSNDEALQREAAIYGVTGWRGEEFIEQMRIKVPERPEAGTEVDVQVSKAEVDEWLALFRAHREAQKRLRQQRAEAKKASPPKPATPGANGAVKPEATPAAKPPTPPVTPPKPKPIEKKSRTDGRGSGPTGGKKGNDDNRRRGGKKR